MKRETSAYERVMFYYSNKGPMFFAFRMVLLGDLNENDLRKTLAKVRKEIPLTAVRVFKDDDKKQWITTDDVPDYPLIIQDNFAGEPADAVIALLLDPFDNEKGPMVRFSLLRNGNRNNLIAVFQHAIGDGVGAVLFLERLLEHLGNPDAEIIPVTDETWAPSSIKSSRKRRWKKSGHLIRRRTKPTRVTPNTPSRRNKTSRIPALPSHSRLHALTGRKLHGSSPRQSTPE